MKKSIIITERKNYNSYHIPGTGNLNRMKRDAVFYNAHNTVWHELMKAMVALMIKKFGYVHVTPEMIRAISRLEAEIELRLGDIHHEQHKFLTEAEENRSMGEARIIRDVVDITEGTIYEIETELKRGQRHKKENKFNHYIKVINRYG